MAEKQLRQQCRIAKSPSFSFKVGTEANFQKEFQLTPMPLYAAVRNNSVPGTMVDFSFAVEAVN